jgi:hypothetical protein
MIPLSQYRLEQNHIDSYADEDPEDIEEQIEEGERMQELAWECEAEMDREEQERNAQEDL